MTGDPVNFVDPDGLRVIAIGIENPYSVDGAAVRLLMDAQWNSLLGLASIGAGATYDRARGITPDLRRVEKDGHVIYEYYDYPFSDGYSRTLGNVICYATPRSITPRAHREHERAHVEQYASMGEAAYLTSHLVLQLVSWDRTGSYNENNYLEWGPGSTPPRAWY